MTTVIRGMGAAPVTYARTTSMTIPGPGGVTDRMDPAAALLEMERALADIRPEVGRRTQGVFVRMDGKGNCNAGPFGVDWGYSKTHPADPINCIRNRDRVLPPVNRVNVPCDSLEDLFWPDIFARCQDALRSAIAGKPGTDEHWAIQANWTRRVMELVSIAYEATNIQPLFYYPAKWATERPLMEIGGEGEEMGRKEWGEYSAAYTYDGREECLSDLGTDLTVAGSGMPRRIHQFLAHTLRTSGRSRMRVAPGVLEQSLWATWGGECPKVPLGGELRIHRDGTALDSGRTRDDDQLIWAGYSGLVWNRRGLTTQEIPVTPSIYNGFPISYESGLVKALRGVNYDLWTTQGFDRDVSHPWLPTSMVRSMRERTDVLGRSTPDPRASARDYLNSQRGHSIEKFMEALFRATRGTSDHYVPYLAVRAGSPDFRMYGPSSKFYIDLAEQWAKEIIGMDYIEFISNSTLFYLVNHMTYYKRLYGDEVISIPTDSIAQMADAVRAGKIQMASMGVSIGASIVGLINPIAAAVSSIVGDLGEAIVQGFVEAWAYPDLPKSLMRRLPIEPTCALDTMSEQGSAALDIIEKSRGSGGADDDPAQSKDANPLLVVGALGGLGLLAYYALKK